MRIVAPMYDERLPFYLLATDDRLTADELNRLTTLEERSEAFAEDIHWVVLRNIRDDPDWQKLG